MSYWKTLVGRCLGWSLSCCCCCCCIDCCIACLICCKSEHPDVESKACPHYGHDGEAYFVSGAGATNGAAKERQKHLERPSADKKNLEEFVKQQKKLLKEMEIEAIEEMPGEINSPINQQTTQLAVFHSDPIKVLPQAVLKKDRAMDQQPRINNGIQANCLASSWFTPKPKAKGVNCQIECQPQVAQVGQSWTTSKSTSKLQECVDFM